MRFDAERFRRAGFSDESIQAALDEEYSSRFERFKKTKKTPDEIEKLLSKLYDVDGIKKAGFRFGEPPNLSDEEVKMVPNGQIGEEEPQLPAEEAALARRTVDFYGNIVFFGLGSVAECTLPILLKHLNVVDYSQITIIDLLDKTDVAANWIEQGIKFVQLRIVKENFEETMEKYLSEGDLLIDLAYDISCLSLLQWCRDHKVLYVNTSVEEWDYTDGFDKRSPYDKSLYARQQEIDQLLRSWKDNSGTTAVLDRGANPGLISDFMKQGILDLAKSKKLNTDRFGDDFASIARRLGIKVVIDTERDTQLSNTPREPGEFVNSWSVLGLMEEATSPVEVGWGSHETKLPDHANIPSKGPKNQIFLSQMGMDTKVRGFVPADPKIDPPITEKELESKNGKTGFRAAMISSNHAGYQIMGHNIRHGEAYSISKFLTSKDEKYRPTVYYCYQPTDAAVASMQEVRANDYRPLPRQRVIYDNEIVSGCDALGVMIGGYDDDHVWWTGSILNIEDAKKLVPLQNCTSIQVAIGLVAGIMWAIENPDEGVCRPEDLPHEYVLKIAKPYLGSFVSKEFEWSPKKNYTNWFPERKDQELDEKNLWGFHNFIYKA
jgi:homospermidine synthase